MPKSMLVNVTAEEEHRVAILDNGVLDIFEIETLSKENLKGNIYKAIVEGVNPALEAAFVNYGGERAGFLPLDEINFKVYPSRNGGTSGKGRGRIARHLEKGMEVLAQVIRDSFATKPPTLSTYYSLPGRYLVLMPGADAAGISRKIEDEESRDRLRRILNEISVPEGFGVIVRTAGMEVSTRELQADLDALLELWRNIDQASRQAKAPALIFQERDLVIRTIRDYYTSDIEEVLIDDEPTYRRARKFFEAHMPDRAEVVRLYTGDKPIFMKFNLEDQIERIYKRVVDLKSGGAISIDQTEALSAIDVNSARSVRSASSEDTATRTNLEAAEEIARQLRLRDIGGLVVIDFIDMESAKNIRHVERVFSEAMARDKARYDITRISKLGLMEVSRQRIRATKASSSFMPCPVCGGDGTVRTPEAAARSAFRKIQARVARGDISGVKVYLPPEVGLYLLNEKRDDLYQLESRLKVRVEVVLEDRMKPHQFEIEEVRRDEEEIAPMITADVVDMAVASVAQTTAPRVVEPSVAARPAATPPPAAPGKRKRRRRRRRGRGTAAVMGENAPAGPHHGPAEGQVEAAPSRGSDESEAGRSAAEGPVFSEGPDDIDADAAPAAASGEPRLPHVADLPLPSGTVQPAGHRRRRRRRRRGRGRHARPGQPVAQDPEQGGSADGAPRGDPARSSVAAASMESPQPAPPRWSVAERAGPAAAEGEQRPRHAGPREEGDSPPAQGEDQPGPAGEARPRRRWWRRKVFKG
jgi:ribonuclease E